MALLQTLIALALTGTGTIHGTIQIEAEAGIDKKDYSDVVVYLADVKAAPTGTAPRAVIRQRNQQFEPRVLPVVVGTSVSFPNDDPREHNAFSHSRSANFDLGRLEKGTARAHVFSKVGVVEVFCHLHKQMVAYVVVAPSKAFAVTGKDGTFTISGVPAGRHALAIWNRHSRPTLQTVTVDVPAGGAADVNLKIREGSSGEPAHKNKFGIEYNPGYR